jgi:hypothetical protein
MLTAPSKRGELSMRRNACLFGDAVRVSAVLVDAALNDQLSALPYS